VPESWFNGLQQSVALQMRAGNGLRLAQAYFAHAGNDGAQRRHWLGKARDACARAQQADFRRQYEQETMGLLTELKRANAVTRRSVVGIP
jgi:hypothetical protein